MKIAEGGKFSRNSARDSSKVSRVSVIWFWLDQANDTTLGGHTFNSTGDELCLTRRKICQFEWKGLRRLTKVTRRGRSMLPRCLLFDSLSSRLLSTIFFRSGSQTVLVFAFALRMNSFYSYMCLSLFRSLVDSRSRSQVSEQCKSFTAKQFWLID